MIDISKIFQNTSGMPDDDQIQFLLDSLGSDDTLDDGILSYLMGGSIPTMAAGGPFDLGNQLDMNGNAMTITLADGRVVPNPAYKPATFNSPNLNYLEGVSHTGVQPTSNPYLSDLGYQGNAAPINFNIGQGITEQDSMAAIRGMATPAGPTPEDPEKELTLDEKLKQYQQMMGMFNSATGGTDYSVEDALYKVGESLAYNPSDDVFKNKDGDVNKTTKGIAGGLNVLKGVTAGGKALLGGAREVMGGFAQQSRNDLIMNEYQKRQILARQNAGMTNAEEGGEIPFFNDGGYLQFLEEGDPVSPFTQDEDVRIPEAAPREIMHNGVAHYVYGEGANTRMVPKSVVDNNANSVYKTDEWMDDKFSSETQQGIRQQALARKESAPTHVNTLPKDEIIRMQQVLIDSGYDIGPTGADGKAGNRTKAAMEQMRAEDPGTYKTWINADFDPLVRAPIMKREAVVKRGSSAPTSNPISKQQRDIENLKREIEAGKKDLESTRRSKHQTDIDRLRAEIEAGKRSLNPSNTLLTGTRRNQVQNPVSNVNMGTPEAMRYVNSRLPFVGYKNVPKGNWNFNPLSREEGGDIPFFNDGGYLQFLEEGDEQQYSEMGPQDPRDQQPITQEMTGEYIQQQPDAAGIVPNAEVEVDEYVQHPDGQVQQVEGRSHAEGGERVALEGGSKVVSDKLKLGARNAKKLSNEYGITVKANDTYATALERYTKKIGLKELNEQQEEYFNKLKKDEKTRDEAASELNSEYLSEKINGIEQKKSVLEAIRSNFTNVVYDLQQGSKTPRASQDDEKKSPGPTPEQIQEAVMMAEGGSITSFEEGGESKVSEKPLTKAQVAKMTPEEYLKYLEGLANLPNAKYKDIAAQKVRWSKLAEINGVDTSAYDLDTQTGQDKLAEDLQNKFRGTYSKTTDHYSTNIAPTQAGLQTALDKGLITEKELNDFGVKTNKGSVLIGSMDEVSQGNSTKITARIKENGQSNPEGFKSFVGSNFNDGKAYYRFPELNTVSFKDEASQNDFIKTGGYELVEDADGKKVYFSKKEGQYFSPEINGDQVSEIVTTDNSQTPVDEYQKPLPKTYERPTLPDMSLEPPRPMEAHQKNQHRYNYLDAVAMSPESQLTEINRQNDAAMGQLEGLTDTQRAAAITNLGANTQQASAKVISDVSAANAQNRFQVDQANAQTGNTEENARVADAQAYEQLQFTAKAKTDADYDDFMEKNREIRIKRFNYLTKDKQMNSIIENYKTDSEGNIMYDPTTGRPLTLGGASSSAETETVTETIKNADGSTTTKTTVRPKGTKTRTK